MALGTISIFHADHHRVMSLNMGQYRKFQGVRFIVNCNLAFIQQTEENDQKSFGKDLLQMFNKKPFIPMKPRIIHSKDLGYYFIGWAYNAMNQNNDTSSQ